MIYQIHFALHYIPTNPSHIVSCHVTFCLIDRWSLKANYWFQRVRTSLLVCLDARVCVCFNVFFCRRLPVCSCSFSYTSAVNLSLSPSLLHTLSLSLSDVQPLLTVGLAKLLSEQMTKNKTVTSFLPTSPMLSVMVHINHTKLPCTQGSLLFLSLPPICPL